MSDINRRYTEPAVLRARADAHESQALLYAYDTEEFDYHYLEAQGLRQLATEIEHGLQGTEEAIGGDTQGGS